MAYFASTSVASLAQNNGLSRSLDKIFEEAQLTGFLWLNGKNLKNFPEAADRYDLTDTVEANLSENRFGEFPVNLCEYVSLETLDLYNNRVRSIPAAVHNLQSLTFLNLTRNQLHWIPPQLCLLPLEVLILTNNFISTLPKEISHLASTLMELDISCNKLESLPNEIGLLKQMRVLNCGDNLLKELPSELCSLMLYTLDISSNQITHLNIDMRQMFSLVNFHLDNNPLVFPPAKVCKKGRVHVFKILEIGTVKQNGQGQLNDRRAGIHSKRSNSTNRIATKTRLIPTDPEDCRFLMDDRLEKRKLRHHTIAADSGYSTMSEETVRLSNQPLNDRKFESNAHPRRRPPSPPRRTTPPSNYSSNAATSMTTPLAMSHSMYGQPSRDATSSMTSSSHYGANPSHKLTGYGGTVIVAPPETSGGARRFLGFDEGRILSRDDHLAIACSAAPILTCKPCDVTPSKDSRFLGIASTPGLPCDAVRLTTPCDITPSSGSSPSSNSRNIASSRSSPGDVSCEKFKSSSGGMATNGACSSHDGRSPKAPACSDATTAREVRRASGDVTGSPNSSFVDEVISACERRVEQQRGIAETSRLEKMAAAQNHVSSLSPSNYANRSMPGNTDISQHSQQLRSHVTNNGPAPISPHRPAPITTVIQRFQTPEKQEQIVNVHSEFSSSYHSKSCVATTLPENTALSASKTFPATPPSYKSATSDVIRSIYTSATSRISSGNANHSTSEHGNISVGSCNGEYANVGEKNTNDNLPRLNFDSKNVALVSQHCNNGATFNGNTAIQEPHDVTMKKSKEFNGNNLGRTVCYSNLTEKNDAHSSVILKTNQTKNLVDNVVINKRSSVSSSTSSVSSASGSTSRSSRFSTSTRKISPKIPVLPSAQTGAAPRGGCATNRSKLSPPNLPTQSFSANGRHGVGSTTSTLVSIPSSGLHSHGTKKSSLDNGNTKKSPTICTSASPNLDRQQRIADELRQILKDSLHLDLPESVNELADALSDGICLCNFLNHLRPRTIRAIHLPSEAVPRITMAKRNVENFLLGCRRFGIAEANLCSIVDVVERKNVSAAHRTVCALKKALAPPLLHQNNAAPGHAHQSVAVPPTSTATNGRSNTTANHQRRLMTNV